MIKKLFTALTVMLFAASAWASVCPSLMGEIDHALEDEATLEEVRDLRVSGEEAHKAGDHDESVALLEEAKEKLGMM